MDSHVGVQPWLCGSGSGHGLATRVTVGDGGLYAQSSRPASFISSWGTCVPSLGGGLAAGGLRLCGLRVGALVTAPMGWL